jgi:two-component system, LytTR family, sensor kinase
MILVLPMLFEIFGFSSFAMPLRGIISGVEFRELKIKELMWSAPCFFIFVFILTTIYTHDSGNFSWKKKIIINLGIAILFYLFSPFIIHGPGNFSGIVFNPGPPAELFNGPGDLPERNPVNDLLNFRRIVEILFVLATTGMLGKIFELSRQRELIKVENEKLRAENLQSQYNLLLHQMNPHFFFNSMNSLSTLVREGRKNAALRYIGELSNTFRYVMQSSNREMVTLEEELNSLSAYCYMLLVRFEGKLFFNIDVEESLMKMMLPVLSLQPLIENVVKHNAITVSNPLTVNVTGRQDGHLVVSNMIVPRQDKPDHIGIGLQNLENRYKLLSGEQITIEDDGKEFIVTLPLKNEMKDENTDNRR